MKQLILSLYMLLVCLGAALFSQPVQAQHGHTHIRYFDQDGNLIEEDDHDHESSLEQGRTFVYSFTGFTPRFGLAVQKNLFAEVGVGLDLYRLGYTEASEYVSFGYSNLRPYVSGEIMVSGRKLLGGGKVGVEYIRSTPLFGMAAGLDASYYTDGGANAITITPRLMLSILNKFEIFYGYNIFVRNELTRWLGHHRVGVSMTFSPGFWRRKKEIYNDYYNSYLTP